MLPILILSRWGRTFGTIYSFSSVTWLVQYLISNELMGGQQEECWPVRQLFFILIGVTQRPKCEKSAMTYYISHSKWNLKNYMLCFGSWKRTVNLKQKSKSWFQGSLEVSLSHNKAFTNKKTLAPFLQYTYYWRGQGKLNLEHRTETRLFKGEVQNWESFVFKSTQLVPHSTLHLSKKFPLCWASWLWDQYRKPLGLTLKIPVTSSCLCLSNKEVFCL